MKNKKYNNKNKYNALKLLFDVFNRYRVVGYAWYEIVCGQIARDMTKRTISDTPLLQISSIIPNA